MNFKCPKCEGTTLEEVMVNVTQTSVVRGFDDPEHPQYGLDYGESSTEGGIVTHYHCLQGGHILKTPEGWAVDTPELLHEWLLQHDML